MRIGYGRPGSIQLSERKETTLFDHEVKRGYTSWELGCFRTGVMSVLPMDGRIAKREFFDQLFGGQKVGKAS